MSIKKISIATAAMLAISMVPAHADSTAAQQYAAYAAQQAAIEAQVAQVRAALAVATAKINTAKFKIQVADAANKVAILTVQKLSLIHI